MLGVVGSQLLDHIDLLNFTTTPTYTDDPAALFRSGMNKAIFEGSHEICTRTSAPLTSCGVGPEPKVLGPRGRDHKTSMLLIPPRARQAESPPKEKSRRTVPKRSKIRQVKVGPRSLVQICLQRVAENFLRPSMVWAFRAFCKVFVGLLKGRTLADNKSLKLPTV